MLPPIGAPLPQYLQDRGYHILETLQGLPVEQQWPLTCRTGLAVLFMRRPSPSVPKAQRDAFRVVCAEVQVWLIDEIAELRRTQPGPKETASRAMARQKVGHA